MNDESPLDLYIEESSKQVRAFIERQRNLCPTCKDEEPEDRGCPLCFSYDHCVECGRELESAESRNIGLGSHCRAEHRMSFTILPNMWDGHISDECEDFIALLNEQAEELNLDFIVVLTWDRNPRFYFQDPHAPFDWKDMVVQCLNGEKGVDTLLRAMLLEEHDYLPHTLCEWEEANDTEKPLWDLLMIALTLNGITMRRSQATPPIWDSYDACHDWHATAPLPKDRLGACEDLVYDGDPDEYLHLGNLSAFDMLRGPGRISDPWHPYNDYLDDGRFSSKSLFQMALLDIWPGNSDCWEWQRSVMEIDPWEDAPMFSRHRYENSIWEEIAMSIDFYGTHRADRDTLQIVENIAKTENKAGTAHFSGWLCCLDQLAWLGYGPPPLFHAQNPIINAVGEILYREDTWNYILDNARWEFLEMLYEMEVYKDCIYLDFLDENENALMRQHLVSGKSAWTIAP